VSIVRQAVALVLLLAFAANHTVLLPALLASGAWLDTDHAVCLVASGDRLEVVLSHHDGQAHANALPSASQPEHRHGWTTRMLVSLAEAPTAGDADHVIQFALDSQDATEQLSATLPVPTPAGALCPPTTQLVTLTTKPAISPAVAARPPPVSQLLLSLRTTVLVV